MNPTYRTIAILITAIALFATPALSTKYLIVLSYDGPGTKSYDALQRSSFRNAQKSTNPIHNLLIDTVNAVDETLASIRSTPDYWTADAEIKTFKRINKYPVIHEIRTSITGVVINAKDYEARSLSNYGYPVAALGDVELSGLPIVDVRKPQITGLATSQRCAASDLPNIDLIAPSEVTVGQEFTATGRITRGVIPSGWEIVWNLGDGFPRTEYLTTSALSITHIYNKLQLFPVTLFLRRQTDQKYCRMDDGFIRAVHSTRERTAPPSEPATSILVDPITPYVNQLVTLSARLNGITPESKNYRWTIDDRTIVLGETIGFRFSEPGTHTIKLTIKTSTRSIKEERTITVTSEPRPDSQKRLEIVYSPTNPVTGDTISLGTREHALTVTNAPNTKWTITDPSGNTLTKFGRNIRLNTLLPGLYTFSVSVETTVGTITSQKTIRVLRQTERPPTNPADYDFSIGIGSTPASSYTNTGVIFTISITGTLPPDAALRQWKWDFGDEQTIIKSTPNTKHTYCKSGVLPVTVTFLYNGQEVPGKSATTRHTVYTNPSRPCNSNKMISLRATPHDPKVGQRTEITALFDGDVPPQSTFLFDFGEGTQSIMYQPSAFFTYRKAGIYTAKVTHLVGYGNAQKTFDPATTNIRVGTRLPTPPVINSYRISVTPGNPAPNQKVTFTIIPGPESSLPTNLQIKWSMGDGKIVYSEEKKTNYTYTRAGNYLIQAIIYERLNPQGVIEQRGSTSTQINVISTEPKPPIGPRIFYLPSCEAFGSARTQSESLHRGLLSVGKALEKEFDITYLVEPYQEPCRITRTFPVVDTANDDDPNVILVALARSSNRRIDIYYDRSQPKVRDAASEMAREVWNGQINAIPTCVSPAQRAPFPIESFMCGNKGLRTFIVIPTTDIGQTDATFLLKNLIQRISP